MGPKIGESEQRVNWQRGDCAMVAVRSAPAVPPPALPFPGAGFPPAPDRSTCLANGTAGGRKDSLPLWGARLVVSSARVADTSAELLSGAGASTTSSPDATPFCTRDTRPSKATPTPTPLLYKHIPAPQPILSLMTFTMSATLLFSYDILRRRTTRPSGTRTRTPFTSGWKLRGECICVCVDVVCL